jgi:hypothetical protein
MNLLGLGVMHTSELKGMKDAIGRKEGIQNEKT